MKIPQINVIGNSQNIERAIDNQLSKALEEFDELREVVISRRFLVNPKQRILDEGLDLKTTVDTLFYLLGYTEKDIKTHMNLHRQKLEIRNDEGRIKIDNWIEV